MHNPTEQSHEEHVQAGRKGGRARAPKVDKSVTESPAKRARTMTSSQNDDFDPELDKSGYDQAAEKDLESSNGKDPVRVEAGKKAAETRARHASAKKSGRATRSKSSAAPSPDASEMNDGADDKAIKKSDLSHDESLKLAHERHDEGGDETDQSAESKSGNSGNRQAEIAEVTAMLTKAGDLRVDLSLLMDPTGKNVIEVIRLEHRLVELLGEKFYQSKSNDERQGIANNIIKLLSVHAACEEMVLYPFLKLKGESDLVQHALDDHTQVKKDLESLIEMKIEDENFEMKLQAALDDTLTHVKEEEEGLLPFIEKISTADELMQLALQFTAAHDIAPTRPHSKAPNEPPANKNVNEESAASDKELDKQDARFQKVQL